jgi:CBS-domain-containing membrane protein
MVGLIALWTVHSIYPQANLADPSIMNKTRIMVIALSMGMIGVCMVTLNFAHPPAAASALLAAMGYFETPRQLLGVECAVVLLVLEAIVFNRIIGGLPYPLWRFDAKTARNFGQIAGIPSAEMTFWRQRAMKTFERR